MKITLAFASLVLGLVIAALASPVAAPVQPAAKVRIGVFDSRAIAIAYVRSGMDTRVADGRKAYQTAKAANDQQKMKDIEQQMEWMQIRLHQQGFSTATVAAYVEKIADKLPAIAADAKVTTIVSKWELHYKDPSVELVDVTMPMVKLFTTNDQVLQMVGQMMAQPPEPFDKLPLSAKD